MSEFTTFNIAVSRFMRDLTATLETEHNVFRTLELDDEDRWTPGGNWICEKPSRGLLSITMTVHQNERCLVNATVRTRVKREKEVTICVHVRPERMAIHVCNYLTCYGCEWGASYTERLKLREKYWKIQLQERATDKAWAMEEVHAMSKVIWTHLLPAVMHQSLVTEQDSQGDQKKDKAPHETGPLQCIIADPEYRKALVDAAKKTYNTDVATTMLAAFDYTAKHPQTNVKDSVEWQRYAQASREAQAQKDGSKWGF